MEDLQAIKKAVAQAANAPVMTLPDLNNEGRTTTGITKTNAREYERPRAAEPSLKLLAFN